MDRFVEQESHQLADRHALLLLALLAIQAIPLAFSDQEADGKDD